MIILGIETSCDETAVAVAKNNDILSNAVFSQIDIHKKYGGVVPEVAAREHVLKILPVVNEAIIQANIKQKDIDAIVVAHGPGLITSLLSGVETAKVLAYVWEKPLIGVNHIEGHIYANFIGETNIKFPALILTVSGGHTMLVLMKDHGKYKILGETRDDAAGEAFDKAAKLLNLGYPGGPEISKEAEKFDIRHSTFDISLPRPMINSKDYDFSFSGLKTALLYTVKDDLNWKKHVPEYCAEFQQAVIDVLIVKTIKAAKEFKVKSVMLAGGVSANKELRKQLAKAVENNLPKTGFNIPEFKYTTDNAAMVAIAGYYHSKRKDFVPWQKIKVDPNLELK